ncbi:MAG: Flp pilus assembly protein CpaB [Phenylobacterium sp.]|uniref:Flp pilus assembly protein CpaB n=1 Tax=Phenylobacterium sp. TaxID=1871053 RepID=UPI0027243033|nr:Flp pilus assembly protein CpaB [Phenylobacterium sp.]MDO8902862.1 Flp pilus assembly protein CpaB [Phenylobacterium sp.]
MGAVRIAILAAAAIAAILLAFIVRGMMTGGGDAPQAPAPVAASPMAQVLVAKQDLPVGTRITPAMIGWQPWPVEALNAAFVTDGSVAVPPAEGAEKVVQKAGQVASDALGASPIQAFDGAIVREAIAAGEPVTVRKVIRGGEGGYMSVVLGPGMRAVSVPVSADTAAGGFILPGDRVDVLQSRDAPDGTGRVTETLMRNLRVLAIDQATEPAEASNTMIGGTITLETPASDVEVLVRGKAQGEMVLALRPYTDIGGPVGRGGSAEPQTVRIFRDGEMSEVSVR